MFLTVIVLFFSMFPRFCSENIRYERIFQDVTYKDTLSTVQPLKSTAATSATICLIDCMNENACRSMSYNDEQELCVMFESRMAGINRVINESGWQFYYKEQNVCSISSGYLYNTELDRCIKVYPGPKNYAESFQACQDVGTTLVRLDSAEMWQFVKDIVVTLAGSVFYIQGSKQSDGVWRYDDNTEMTVIQWASGQPNDASTIYLTMRIEDGFLVHDASGNSNYGYVCEINLQ